MEEVFCESVLKPWLQWHNMNYEKKGRFYRRVQRGLRAESCCSEWMTKAR